MPKDFHIWVELAQKKRKCHQCGGTVNKGTMFVRMGKRDHPLGATSMCASCFDKVMNELSQEFQEMKDAARSPTPEAAPVPNEAAEAPLAYTGPRCFVCGLEPEKCQCAREAYR